MEGVIKNVKQQPDGSLDCSEPALYFHSRWKDLKATNRTFVADLEKMNHVFVKWKDNTEPENVAKETKERKTKDAMNNEAFMKEDDVWDTGARGSEAEFKLRCKLEEFFLRKYGKKNYRKWHEMTKERIVDTCVGNVRGVGNDIFVAWMGNRRASGKFIGVGAMKGMEHFVTNWESWDKYRD